MVHIVSTLGVLKQRVNLGRLSGMRKMLFGNIYGRPRSASIRFRRNWHSYWQSIHLLNLVIEDLVLLQAFIDCFFERISGLR